MPKFWARLHGLSDNYNNLINYAVTMVHLAPRRDRYNFLINRKLMKKFSFRRTKPTCELSFKMQRLMF